MFLFLTGGFSATFLQRLEKIFCFFRSVVDAVEVAVEKRSERSRRRWERNKS